MDILIKYYLFQYLYQNYIVSKLSHTHYVFFVCFVLSLQVGIWPTQPYLGIPLTFPPQARAATQPPRLLEWFLVSERQRRRFISSLGSI